MSDTTGPAAKIPEGFPDLSKSRFDQSSYLGRVRHFIEITDPRTLFSSEAQLQRAKQLMDDFKRCIIHDNVSVSEYWKAKKLCEATFHADTGEKVFLPFRMSCFVPTNMFVLFGMLNSSPTFAGIVFWQWLNQSVNVAVNYANANKTTPMSMTETATAYAGAVTASCGVALGLNRLAEQGKLPRPLIRLIPFTAVAIAGTANVFLMRQKELREGIAVTDEQGNEVGKSTAAGWQAVSQVAVSRVATAAPCLVVPPMVMSRLKPLALFRNNPRLLIPAELAVVAGSLMGALPCAIALFPQQAKVPVSSLEPKFHNFKDTEGNPITHVFYNKGL
ncbi:Tricarboxylate/iron carrier [Catenaria anguillulae PL171]|uniref:Sidoreflexin n=1 Tax=Catenaria anguillulae PL171 TaxID=765915 RepID=A0A1Y2HLS1_9FUNG|nr:Tricarboxylate/iron carrier [Catenaria anguillulae PL171]